MVSQHDSTSVRLVINGEVHTFDVPSTTRLLDLLRQQLGLTAAKEGCGCGECGACTVLLDDRPVNACLISAVDADGGTVTTLEGLDADPVTARLQRALVAAGAVQCGYCTPGFLMATRAFLRHNPDPTDDEIRLAFEGNLCRCSGYVKIKVAIVEAARQLREGGAAR